MRGLSLCTKFLMQHACQLLLLASKYSTSFVLQIELNVDQ